MVVLQGRVLDRRCRGVAGATIDVWYGAREDQHGENHYRGIMTSIHHITFMPCVPGDAYYTFRPGDANCLPDNVNCDGNLWYRGKVDTSEVFFCFFV